MGGKATFYHGTTLERLTDIAARGLSVRMDNSWRETGPGIYLTDCEEVAGSYGPVILEVSVDLGQVEMAPDDYELLDHFAQVNGDAEAMRDWAAAWEAEHPGKDLPEEAFVTWRESLQICRQCRTFTDIPAAWVRVVAIGDRRFPDSTFGAITEDMLHEPETLPGLR